MRFLLTLVALISASTVETTFLSAIAGGAIPFSSILTLVVARMTMSDRSGILSWLIAGAVAAELYAVPPFGTAAASVAAASASVRLLLFGVFSHRSLPARVTAAFLGVAVGTTTSSLIRAAAAVVAGEGMIGLPSMLHATLATTAATGAAACVASLIVARFERDGAPRIVPR